MNYRIRSKYLIVGAIYRHLNRVDHHWSVLTHARVLRRSVVIRDRVHLRPGVRLQVSHILGTL